MERDDDAFVVVSEEGGLDFNWQELLLVLLQGQLIYYISHHIVTSYHELLIHL